MRWKFSHSDLAKLGIVLVGAKTRVGFKLAWYAFNQIRTIKWSSVSFKLVSQSVKTSINSCRDNIIDDTFYLRSIIGQWDNKVVRLGDMLILLEISLIKLTNSVDLTHFRNSSEEIICGNRGLAFEKWEPKTLRISVFESFYHLLSNVVVYDVLEINKIKVVGPGMKNTETLMFDSLNSVLLNVFLYELVGCFISRDWVGKIIGINGFLRVANERANRFDARRWLQILVFDVSVEQLGKTIKASDIKLF